MYDIRTKVDHGLTLVTHKPSDPSIYVTHSDNEPGWDPSF